MAPVLTFAPSGTSADEFFDAVRSSIERRNAHAFEIDL
jgi:hypothetical protein